MGVSVLDMCVVYVFFFFQAEDGIRDYKVTGVQTCALPISGAAHYGSEIPGQTTGLSTDPPDNLTVIRGKQSQARRQAGCGQDWLMPRTFCNGINAVRKRGAGTCNRPQHFCCLLRLRWTFRLASAIVW